MVFRSEFLQGKSKLPHVIRTLNPLRPRFGLSNRREQKHRQNPGYGNNHQKLC